MSTTFLLKNYIFTSFLIFYFYFRPKKKKANIFLIVNMVKKNAMPTKFMLVQLQLWVT